MPKAIKAKKEYVCEITGELIHKGSTYYRLRVVDGLKSGKSKSFFVPTSSEAIICRRFYEDKILKAKGIKDAVYAWIKISKHKLLGNKKPFKEFLNDYIAYFIKEYNNKSARLTDLKDLKSYLSNEYCGHLFD